MHSAANFFTAHSEPVGITISLSSRMFEISESFHEVNYLYRRQ